MKSDITLITAIHNGDEYLNEAIASVLGQTYPHFRWIIVDDASDKPAAKILREAAAKDSRIQLICNPSNLGLTKSLNIALEQVTSPFVARIDGDDVCYPTRLEKQRQFLLEHTDMNLCGSWARVIDKNGQPTGQIMQPLLPDASWRRRLFQANVIAHSTWFGRTAALRAAGGYDPHYRQAQDYDLLLRLASQGRIGIVPEILLDYRVTSGSISQTKMQASLGYALAIRKAALARKDVPWLYRIYLIKPWISLLVPPTLKQLIWRTK